MVLLPYLLVALFVVVINAVPMFMPSTWMVLAFLYHKFDLLLLPTVIIGAAAALTGRVILYYLAKYILRDLFPKRMRENLDGLGQLLNQKRELTIPLMITYAFSPISSNQLFIAAGLAGANLKTLAISFLLGRLASYTFWVSITQVAVDRMDDLFSRSLFSPQSILTQVSGIAMFLLISSIPWKALYHKHILKRSEVKDVDQPS